jgi:PAS domain S-box-containing protein
MKDERKTKKQLIDELTQLRQRLSQESRHPTEASGRTDGTEARNQDNTIRRRMEELLRASVEQWYTIFNTMNDAICLLDSQSRIQRCNRAMVELVDKPLGEILGHHCWEVVIGISEPLDKCPLVRMRESLSKESLVMPLGDRWFNVSVDPLLANDGRSIGAVFVMTDITERKQAEEERSANVRFLECLDRVNRAVQGTNDLEQMMSDVLDEVLSIFDCDRAWFVYPCDPEATTWWAPMERTRPEYPGALTLELEMPVDSQVAQVYKAVLASDDPVGFGPGNEQPLPANVAKKFNEQSQLAMAVYPKVDKPYMFGIHQCSRPRLWTLEERRLLKEIGTRLADSLTSLLVYLNLKERENKYRELANSITDVFFAMDTDLKYTYWNKTSENLTGIKAEDAIGKTISEVFPDTEETRKATAVYQDVLEKKQAKSFEMEYQLEDKHHFFEINAYYAEDGIAVFAKDIAERKRVEEALTRQAEQLHVLSARLADAQEVERRRIARELHDQVGQNLTVLGINLNTLRPHLAQAPEEVRVCLNDSLGLVKQTTGRIRGVMADLRPPELDDYGLLSALRWYADQIGARAGLAVAVQGEAIHPRLSSQQATALFRIAQEALTNVVKHAQATRATVTLEASEERARMVIADDGLGFDPASLETTSETPHWGLLTMKERAQAIGARWRVESRPGGGTRVAVELTRHLVTRPEGEQQ